MKYSAFSSITYLSLLFPPPKKKRRSPAYPSMCQCFDYCLLFSPFFFNHYLYCLQQLGLIICVQNLKLYYLHNNGSHPLFFGLQKVLSQVLQEAGYTKESYLMLDDFIKVIYVLSIFIVTIEFYVTQERRKWRKTNTL